MTEAICAALLDGLVTEHEQLLKLNEVPPDGVVDGTVPRSSCRLRYGMCQAGARVYFRPGCGRLQSAFKEQERGQKRRGSAGYHHRYPTCMSCRCEFLPGPDPGSTLAIDLKDGDDFSCSGDKMYRLGGGRPCVFVDVGVRHRRHVGQVQRSSSHSQ